MGSSLLQLMTDWKSSKLVNLMFEFVSYFSSLPLSVFLFLYFIFWNSCCFITVISSRVVTTRNEIVFSSTGQKESCEKLKTKKICVLWMMRKYTWQRQNHQVSLSISRFFPTYTTGCVCVCHWLVCVCVAACVCLPKQGKQKRWPWAVVCRT